MKRSKFSLSHYKLFSADMGFLLPIGLTEVLPGDTVQQATSLLLRVSPLLAPVMHPVHVRIHHWFVPHRLVWDKWEDFITGGPDGMDATVFPTMVMNSTYAGVGSLGDYLGLPIYTNSSYPPVSALPWRGYAMIWNEWYRDQDLQTELVINKGSGNDTTTSKILQKVNWEKDYFTSSRPWTQKGPTITLPLSGDAPIKGIGFQQPTGPTITPNIGVYESDGLTDTYAQSAGGNATQVRFRAQDAQTGVPNIFADLSGVSATTINDLRLAFALQRYEEARARYGSRYTEYLSYLGVRSSDARLQRPEYLGGGKQTIQFSEVLQSAPTTSGDDTVGVGNLRGHGIAALRSNRYRRFFEEHGFVFSLMSVRPRTMYTQGIARHWSRRVKEDFWQRELEHIGQQEVHNKEVYVGAASPDGVFGYQDRYDEYRRTESGVAGEFRTTELDFWHMARQFASEPVLNSSFVAADPTKRINAVSDAHVLWVMANHSIQARRMLSKRGTSHIF